MPKLRVKIEINKGGVGVKLFKLSGIAEESLRFFQMLCKDAGIDAKPADWIAQNFGNECVDYECQTEKAVPKRKADRYTAGLRSVVNFTPNTSPFTIRRGTIRQFSHITKSLDAKEVVSFGIFRDPNRDYVDWFHLSREMGLKIQAEIPACVRYYGQIQGIVHAFHKEADDPHVTIREHIFGGLVKCFFPRDQYDGIVNLLREKSAVVYTEGMISENIITGEIESVESERYKVLKPITYLDLDAIFGTDDMIRREILA